MTRRLQTLVTGVIVLCGLALLLAFIRVPYVSLVPGPTVNTLGDFEGEPVIAIQGKQTDPGEGNLNLTTVGVIDEITIFQAIAGWFSDDAAIVPRESVYPPTQTREETNEQNRAEYVQSESAAIQAAMNYLDYPKKVVVVDAPDDIPLAPGDALEAVDGQPVPDAETLTTVLTGIEPGTEVSVDYLHDGEPVTTTIVTQGPPEDRAGSLLGITVTYRGYGGFSVSFAQNDIGGPSAGLMLTLGIIDLVGEQPLVDDEFIAGTGTIDPDGNVGAIGGVRFKLKKAAEVGAAMFLTPADNCAEALIDPPDDGPVIAKVATLEDAVEAIEALRAGEPIDTCS